MEKRLVFTRPLFIICSPVKPVSTSYQDSQLKVVNWEFILGVRWYDIPHLGSIERYRELQTRHLQLLAGKKALIISYADASSDRLHFDSGLRKAVEVALKDASSGLMGMAQIIAGEGFGAASVRSVLPGIQLAVRPNYPIRLFGDTDTACTWLEELLLEAKRDDLAHEVGSLFLPEIEKSRG